jgi:serine/threonine protein kinase
LGTWFVFYFVLFLKNKKICFFFIGVLLFEMIFGYRPFEHIQDNFDKMSFIARLTQNPIIPPTNNPHVHDVLQRCLQINSTHRPNADQLLKHSFFSN